VDKFVKYFLRDEVLTLYRIVFLNVLEAAQKRNAQQMSQLMNRRKDLFTPVAETVSTVYTQDTLKTSKQSYFETK
jgi:hypothetical protein